MYAVCRNHSSIYSLFVDHYNATKFKKTKQQQTKEEGKEEDYDHDCINATNQDGMTALYLASRENALECVEILLERGGANPNVASNTMRTPLHVAIKVTDFGRLLFLFICDDTNN